MAHCDVANNIMYTKCQFCGAIYSLALLADVHQVPPRHDLAPYGCPLPLPPNPREENDGYTCYTCGMTEGYDEGCVFSRNQLEKGALARCKQCTSTKQKERFGPFQEELNSDQSIGGKLLDAVTHCEPEKVIHLLELAADPNYSQQAALYLSGGSRVRVTLWNKDGTRAPAPDWDSEVGRFQPMRPLSLVGFYASHMDSPSQHDDLAIIAKYLIDAGANMVHGENIIKDRYGMVSSESNSPALAVIGRARNAIDQILRECQECSLQQQQGGGGSACFNFVAYFDAESPRVGCLQLTEKAVLASSELRPFYDAYTLERANERLRSQHQMFFAKAQALGGKLKEKLLVLPALPKEIEVRIRALAVISNEEKPICASQIPAPLV